MEKHKCKLCSRTFSNGRALGGHMKAHLATLPPPPPPPPPPPTHWVTTESATSSSTYEEDIKNSGDDEQVEEKASMGVVYGLRENPKRSFRLADPEFSFAIDANSVVQDRESETESRINPTRRRSKRIRKSGFGEHKKANFNAKNEEKVKILNGFVVESPPVSSVISDASTDEDVALCLMMLSRDVWMSKNGEKEKNKCKCGKKFRSLQALGGHKRICSYVNGREVKEEEEEEEARSGNSVSKVGGKERVFECPYCFKVFGSGQALGGHKRSHLIVSSAAAAVATTENSAKVESNLIDLNLPAPMDDDEFSVVSDG